MALTVLNSPVRVRLLTGRLLTGAGLALLPWMGFLAATLPPAQAVAWVALDGLEAYCLITAGLRLARGHGGHRIPTAAAALLLAVDATADLLTSAPGTELAQAVTMAVCAELPLAALCVALARRGPRPPRGEAAGGPDVRDVPAKAGTTAASSR
ncbi:hypothetical protein ACFYVL_18770 [Streptomyces sp. NPDC004111]|uniref:hypothetical protein n=1 Tax=Streptomyces sp. NPDC004111 TaxID=3364690 RepID=UPI0036BD276C